MGNQRENLKKKFLSTAIERGKKVLKFEVVGERADRLWLKRRIRHFCGREYRVCDKRVKAKNEGG